MAWPSFFRVSTEALLHRRTGHGGRKGVGGGRLQPLQLQTIFTGKALMIRAKSTRGQNILQGSQGQACCLLNLTFVLSKAYLRAESPSIFRDNEGDSAGRETIP